MNTLTKKDKLALQVSLALVAGMFSLVPVAQGAPVLDKVVSGGAVVNDGDPNPQTNTTVTSQNPNNIINWKDFSIGKNESVVFDGGEKTHNYMNVVTGEGTSYINGAMSGGKNVYLVNSHGVIMGENAQIDVGNLYVSTKDLTNVTIDPSSLENGKSAIANVGGKAAEEVVNMGHIQAKEVYVEGTNIRFLNAAYVTSDGSTPLTGVILKGSGYVHVGYEKGEKAPTEDLKYDITSSSKEPEHDHILIHNDVNQLQNLDLGENYMLAENVELNPNTPFIPIGLNPKTPYKGSFDGNFFEIKNISVEAQEYAGLFGATSGAKIRNLGMRDAYVSANVVDDSGDETVLKKAGYGGAIVGRAYNTYLENIYSVESDSPQSTVGIWPEEYSAYYDGDDRSFYKANAIGGLVGEAAGGTIINNAYNTLSVANGGGLVGNLESSTIKNSYNAGKLLNQANAVDDNYNVAVHYGIADSVSGNSNISNVYNAGKISIYVNGSEVKDKGVAGIGPAIENSFDYITNGYVVTSTEDGTGAITEATFTAVGTNNAIKKPGDYTSEEAKKAGLQAESYGFFKAVDGSTDTAVTYNDNWRIYEGHTLPLLRSFLKHKSTGSKGTIPVSYTYNLYANKTGGESVKTLTSTNADGTITYTGYYVGIDNVKTDTTRGLSTKEMKKIKAGDTTTRIKDVNPDESITAFYSTGQDGYDLAGDTLRISARNLAPSGNRKDIDKVYDGTSDASTAIGDGLLQKIDLRKFDKDPGYGIVEVYETATSTTPLRVDDVSIYAGTTDSDGNIVPGSGFIKSAVYDNGPNVTNDSHITYTVNKGVDALTGADAGNYTLTEADLKNIKFYGDITQRPVYVSLNKDGSIDKTYDGTSHVVSATEIVKDGDGNAVLDSDGHVKTKYNTNDIDVKKVDDSGLIGKDGVELVVSDAYYANKSDGSKAVNANPVTATTTDGVTTYTPTDSYNVVYALALSGEASKVANYVLKDAASKDVITQLTGEGVINRREVALTDVAILDANGDKITKAAKTYDFSSAYDGGKGVTFSVDGGVTEASAVSQDFKTGVLENDASNFGFKLGSQTFYTGDGKNDKAAFTVSTAKKVQYKLTPTDADALANYTINGNTIESTGVDYYGDGEITKRAITVDMVPNLSPIDKYYDASADVVDKDDKNGYMVFRNSGASGVVSTDLVAPNVANENKGYVGYTSDTANKLVVDDVKDGKSRNDGTTFDITAVYTKDGADGVLNATKDSAADVYYDETNPAEGKDKKIIYTVTLSGKYADNYTLNGKDATSSTVGETTTVTGPQAELDAVGAINPRKITGITFAEVSKTFDGSDQVGEVNGVTQKNNQIKVKGVEIDTSDGATLTSIGENLDTILGTKDGVVSTDKITGTYGNVSGTEFVGDAHAHWNGTSTDTSGNPVGESRTVRYTGLKNITSGNHNYTTVGISDYYDGKGTINPLTIEALSASGDGNISKIYDGTVNVVGGYQIKYDTSTEHNTTDEEDIVGVLKKHKNDASDVQTALGTITGTGKGVNGEAIEVKFGNVNDAVANYTVDAGNTIYNSTHVNEANNITYAISFANPGTDDIDFALKSSDDANANGYTSYGTNGAKIVKDTGSGIITARNIYTQGKTGLSKTYDGDNIVKDSTGTKMTGENVVKFNPKDDISGLVGIDNVTNASEAVYSGDTRTGFQPADANVYSDGVHTTADGAKYVTYTVKLSDNNAHGDYVIYKNTNGDTYYAPGDTYTLSGNNIEQKELAIGFKDIAKDYDTNDKVLGAALTTVIDADTTGKVEGNTVTLTGTVSDDSVKLAIKDTSAFLEDTANNLAAADVGDHKVRYDLVSNSADLKNYHLIPKDSSNPVTVTKNNDGTYNVTVYGTGKIDPLTIEAITAAIEAVTKVYDGNANLTYSDHTAANGYDSTQAQTKQVTSADKVGTIKLGSLELKKGTGKYTVNDEDLKYGDTTIEGTKFDDSDVGTHTVKYSITISQDVMKNLTIKKDDVEGADSTIKVYKDASTGEYTITKTTTGNNIIAKNAYAYLNSDGLAADPTKIYDGNKNTNVSDAKSYVEIKGLTAADKNNYTVSSAYESSDVAVEDGQAVVSKNNVDYTVGSVSNNYNLYTVDKDGNIFKHDANHNTTDTGYNYDKSTGNLTKDTAPTAVLGSGNDMSALVESPTKVLVGKGTINQKEVTFNASLAQKTYDAKTNVKLAGTEDGDEAPEFSLNGWIKAGDVKFATTGDNAISGEYVVKDSEPGKYVADANVALGNDGDAAYKAVRYKNVAASMIDGNTKATNYKLVAGSDKNSIYEVADDSWVFTAEKGKGKITKRSISELYSEWGKIEKEYDTTDKVVLKDAEGNVVDASTAYKVYGVSSVDPKLKIPISYELKNAVYGEVSGGAIGTTYKDASANPYNVVYEIDKLSAKEMQNFTLSKTLSTDNYIGFQTTTGTIIPRVISGKVTTELQKKTYNGNTKTATANDTNPNSYNTYFKIDDEDLKVLNDDTANNVTDLAVTGTYNDKNAGNGKDVYYKVKWADGNARSNYTFADDNGTGADYTGKGDIYKRVVYVTDTGGEFETKVYDGSDKLVDADGNVKTVSPTKFKDKAVSGNTGIVDDDVELSTVVNGTYDGKDVERDSSGKVINKAVKYSGFKLEDTDKSDGDETSNYYLKADDDVTSVTLTNGNSPSVNSTVTATGEGDNLVITENTGGLINPKEIILRIASPEKTYDATADVEADDMKAYEKLNAKADAADTQDVSKHFDSANNAVFELHPGTGQDDVTVEITGASYDTKDVSYDENGKGNKVTTFNISWHNGNYDFVSETEENGDTFEEKSYSASNGKVNRTGELKDHTSTINPLELHISSMNATKPYDGNPYYSYTGSGSSNGLTVSFGDVADAVIQKDINMSDNTAVNNVGFLGLTVSKGTYQEATEAAKTAAAKAGVSQEDIDAGLATDAAFDEKSGSFQHGVNFSGIALDSSNANYKNYKLMDDSFNYSESGTDTKNTNSTGTIERATVTAHASNGEMYTESRLPSFSGRLTGFLPGDTTTIQVPVTTVTVDDLGNEVEETTYVPKEVSWEEYYKSYFSWGPDSNIDTSNVGSYPVYGWYRKTVDGAEGLYKSSNLGKNYVLAQDPGTLTITRYYASDGSGSGGSTGKASATTVVLQPASSAPAAKTETAAANNVVPAPVVEALTTGYVEKPTTPDSSVYQNVSKDNSNTGSYEGTASIQYGNSTTTLDSSDGSSSGTIGIEVAEVVNLLGGDVASDGTMSLTNTSDGQALSVESTENGYLSVGSAGSEGSIGIETEGGIVSADNGEREGTIGLETEGSSLNADNGEKEGTISLETEEGVLNANGTDKEGTIGLETKDEVLLDTEQGKELLSITSSDEESGTTKEGSISIKSSSKDGEAEITSAGSRLAKADEVQEKDEDKDKEDEEEKNSEEESNKEGEAAIAYSDVA